MKSITLTIIAAAMVSACGSTPPQERTMQPAPQGVPASSSSDVRQAVPASSAPAVRQEATPNINLQMYDNPDLHLAALELRTVS